jgi:SAM-dependent methyltransferase
MMYGPNQYNYCIGKKKYINSEKEIVERYFEALKDIEKIKQPGKVLEIGSATGFFLKAAQMRGWKVYGVEICKAGVDYARREFAIETFLGTLEEAGFPSKFFDLIVMYHTLEHLADPSCVLRETNRVLKDDGIINISVPNMSCYQGVIRGKKWGAFELPAHLYCFSPRTLQKIVEKAGFTIIRGRGAGEINVFLKKGNSFSRLIPSWIKLTLEGYVPFLQPYNFFNIYNKITSLLKTHL